MAMTFSIHHTVNSIDMQRLTTSSNDSHYHYTYILVSWYLENVRGGERDG